MLAASPDTQQITDDEVKQRVFAFSRCSELCSSRSPPWNLDKGETRMRWMHLWGAACIASLLPSGARADLIFDQTVELTGNAIPSDFDAPQQLADNFQL